MLIRSRTPVLSKFLKINQKVMFNGNERSEYSYIGLVDFFLFWKSPNFFSVFFLFSRFDLYFLFKFSIFPLLKGRSRKT